MNIRGQMKLADFYLKLYKGELNRISGYEFVPQKQEFTPKSTTEKTDLPRSSPEEQGMSSEHINAFIKDLSKLRDANVHSILLMRRGKVVTEAHFSPFSAQYPHMLYSLSKSVLSMAVGIAIQEKYLSLDDKIIDVFSEKALPFRSGRLNMLTVRHLLTMQSGVKFNELNSVLEPDWIKGFMQSDFLFEPGTQFHYNSLNSYVLSALLCRKTGMGLVEYLTPRLFAPLGIQQVTWEKCPNGIEKGGWGLNLRIEDMAKLGQLYLQKGRWKVDGKYKQLVPKSWVEESTHNHIKKCEEASDGYGYQIWMCAMEGAFNFNGVFGQYVLVVPKYDFVIAITAGNQNLFPGGSTLELIYRYFNQDAVFGKQPLPRNKGAQKTLEQTCKSLVFLQSAVMPKTEKSVPFIQLLRKYLRKDNRNLLSKAQQSHNGKEYVLEKSFGALLPLVLQGVHANFTSGIERVKLMFINGVCNVTFTEDKNTNTISAGLDGTPRYSKVNINGEIYVVGSMARWTTDEDDHDVLKLFISFIETPNTRILKLIFLEEGTVQVKFDEVPSVRASLKMLEGLVGGDTMISSRVRERMQKMLAPEAMGRLEDPAKTPRSGNTPST